MFWIKFILIAAILLVVLLLGLEFSTLNTNAVTVRYLLGTTTQPLSLVVICAFFGRSVRDGFGGCFRCTAAALAGCPTAASRVEQRSGDQLAG